MGPKKKGKTSKKKAETGIPVESGSDHNPLEKTMPRILSLIFMFDLIVEYDTMDLEMLREVVPMLRQQLDKSMLDRNYVQLERVSHARNHAFHTKLSKYP